MARHSELIGDELHTSIPFVFLDEAERLAKINLADKDLGKLAWQRSDNSFYCLVSHTPIKWEPIASQSLFQKLSLEQVTSIEYNDVQQISKIFYTNNFRAEIYYTEALNVDYIKFFTNEELIEKWNYGYDELYRIISLNIETF